MSNAWHPENDGHPDNRHPEHGRQYPQPDWERWEAEHGPPPLESVERPAPVDVETARHLWWGVIGLGMLTLVMTLFVVNGQKSEFAQQLLNDISAQEPSYPLTLESAESYLTAALFVMLLVGAAFSALVLLWVKRMRLGKLWARTVLTIIGTITAALAFPQLFAFGVDGGALPIMMSVAGILQGVLAVGAIVLMHRKDANAYFVTTKK